MAENPEPNNLDDDVQIIRQILFGEQLQEVAERIKILEAKLLTLEKENRKLKGQLGKVTVDLKKVLKAHDENAKMLAARLESIVASFDERLLSETEPIRKALNTYKRTAGGKFSRIEKKTESRFAQMQTHQDNLISSLAGALMATRHASEDPAVDGD